MNTQHKCAGRVWGGYSFSVCGRNAAYEHEGKHYCKTHHPPTVAAKNAAKHAAWEAEYQRKEAGRKEARDKAAEQERRAEMFPELLEQLQELVAWMEARPDTGEIVKDAIATARDVIAKATGEQS